MSLNTPWLGGFTVNRFLDKKHYKGVEVRVSYRSRDLTERLIMSQIPLACADFSFPLLPHDLALDLIAGMGIGAVDISLMFQNSHLDVEDALARPAEVATDLARRLSRRGLAIADVNFTPRPGLQDPRLEPSGP